MRTEALGQTWLVAWREIQQRGKSRVFAIGTAIMLIAVGLGVALPALLASSPKPQHVGVVSSNTAAASSIVTEAGRLAGSKVIVVPEPTVAAAKAGLLSGKLDVALIDGNEVLVKQVALATNSGGALPSVLAQLAGLSRLISAVPGAAAAVTKGVALPVRGLTAPPTSLGNRLTGLFTIVLVWMLISIYGQQIAQSVGEEKSSRVVEVLLASVRPVQLLMGKVLGIGLLAIGQVAAMVGVFVVAGYASGSGLVHGAAINIVLVGGLFAVLGYAFFCTAYAAAGSLVSRQSDVNATIFPVQLPLILAYALSFSVIYATNSNAFYHLLGFLPPTAPIAMPVLYAAGDVPAWQVALSAVILVAGIVWMGRLAVRIYTRSILRTGPRIKLSQALREREPAGTR
jgi:ABC-2 type transport system permease protein